MTRVDPRKPDPRFPDRPTHVDFADLSEAIQDIDERSEVENPLAILGVDLESLRYLAAARMQMMQTLNGVTLSDEQKALAMVLYVDAFTLGRTYESKRES